MSDSPSVGEARDTLSAKFRAIEGDLFGWFRRRVLDPVEAEDLVQDCFLRITQAADLDAIVQFESYVFRTARSVLTDRARRRGARAADAHVALDPDQARAEDADALRALLAKERLDRVAAAIRLLPDRTREVFVLRRLEEMRYAEIAARLRISVSAVEKHVARAVELLAASIGEEA